MKLIRLFFDSNAYTEINFAAFAMLGLRFCPRIRGVQHQRIYRIDPNRDYGSLASLSRRADQTIDTEQIAEHWDRMGQLYASLKTGHVTASVALKRLVGFSAKNRFYRAKSGSRAYFQDRVHPPVPLGARAAPPHPARLAQGRATPRLGQRCLLRAAGPD